MLETYIYNSTNKDPIKSLKEYKMNILITDGHSGYVSNLDL